MPLFMLRSSPFWIAVILLGGMMPVARGADPPCTSQIPPVSPPAPTAPGAASTAPKTNPADLPIVVTTDEFDGDASAATLKGNVEVRQGDRQIKGNQMQYQDENGVRSIESNQHLDYEDSLVHVTGESGSTRSVCSWRARPSECALYASHARPCGRSPLKSIDFASTAIVLASWMRV